MLPVDIYNQIYQAYFTSSCVPELSGTHDLRCVIRFEDIRKFRAFIAFHTEILTDGVWEISRCGSIRLRAMDYTQTCLIQSSVGKKGNFEAYREVAVNLRTLLLALKYDKTGTFQLELRETLVDYRSSTCSGSIPRLDINENIFTVPEYPRHHVMSTVRTSDFFKAVAHVAEVSNGSHVYFEAYQTHLQIKTYLDPTESLNVSCSLNGVRVVAAQKICIKLCSKYVLLLAKAYKRHYPRSTLTIRMKDDFPMALELQDEEYMLSSLVAPMS